MTTEPTLALFSIDSQRYALRVSVVERAIQALEITPLPDSPYSVLGIINVSGAVLPVYDARARFGLPARSLASSDTIILARSKGRRVGLLVDALLGLESASPADCEAGGALGAENELIAGVVRRPDGLVLIHDLDAFLSQAEEKILDSALSGAEGSA